MDFFVCEIAGRDFEEAVKSSEYGLPLNPHPKVGDLGLRSELLLQLAS